MEIHFQRLTSAVKSLFWQANYEHFGKRSQLVFTLPRIVVGIIRQEQERRGTTSGSNDCAAEDGKAFLQTNYTWWITMVAP